MSDIPNPEASRQPHIETVRLDGSTAQIYEPELIIDQAQSAAVRIYDRADFGTPIERAQLDMSPVRTDTNEQGVSFGATIQLDRSRNDIGSLEKRLKDTFIEPHQLSPGKLEISKTVFSNAFTISDRDYNTRAVVVISGGRVTISNHKTLRSQNPEKADILEIQAPVVGTVDETDYLKGMARIFMKTLDSVKKAGSNSYTLNPSGLRREYRIAEGVQNINQPQVTSGLGQAAGRGTVESPQSQPEDGNQQPEQNIEEQLGVDVLSGEITLDDIGGLDSVKEKLREIAISFKNPEIMEKWGAARPQGVLLYGEPGTGKTMLVEALAHEIGAQAWAVQGNDIYDRWLGESEQRLKELFDSARQVEEPTIILFDEFDSIIGITDNPGAGGAGQARNAVAGLFKQEMNTLAKENPNILVVATTNHPDRIDQALIRSGRFDYRVYVPMPNDGARSEIIAAIVGKAVLDSADKDFAPYGDDVDVSSIAKETDGMSGADISEIFRRITLEKAMQEARSGETAPISNQDIMRTIRLFKTQG